MSASRQQLTANQKKTAGYLQQHPRERLRLERIARDTGLTSQQASIALCGLLNGGLLPGADPARPRHLPVGSGWGGGRARTGPAPLGDRHLLHGGRAKARHPAGDPVGPSRPRRSGRGVP